MKNIFFTIPILLFLSCRSSKAMTANPTEQKERQEQLEDSVLINLQQNNELVLAFAVETYAWARTKNYKILTLNNNEWKGYNYKINNSTHSSSGLIPVTVSADSCDALWKFIKEKDATKITGDNGKDFCPGDKNKNCNINDGATWRLLFITKDSVITPSYYEPQFYEDCCPGNANRQLFLGVAGKIKNIAGDTNGIEK
jgi:hypothetical protein